MKIQSKLGRRSLSLACATLLATGAVTLTTQTAVAATQVLGSQVSIQPRDITTSSKEILNFGKIKVGSGGGTVTVTSDGSQTFGVSGDVVQIESGVEGQLGILGEKGIPVSVVVDPTITLTAQTESGPMDITVSTETQGNNFILLAENGVVNLFQIGGVLNIPANQPAGLYSGTYNATVNYQ